MKCSNLSDGARRRMTKMVDAGHFDSFPPEVEGKVEAKPTSKNLSNGTALVAVEDDSESEGDDDKSALPSLEELLREQGYIHLNVAAEKAWDGDTVSDFGFGCLHFGRARASPVPNGVVFAGAGDELIGSPEEWITVKRIKKDKAVSKKIPPVSPQKQASKRPVWLEKLVKKKMPRLRAKKMT